MSSNYVKKIVWMQLADLVLTGPLVLNPRVVFMQLISIY